MGLFAKVLGRAEPDEVLECEHCFETIRSDQEREVVMDRESEDLRLVHCSCAVRLREAGRVV